jgi:hypothetical protein
MKDINQVFGEGEEVTEVTEVELDKVEVNSKGTKDDVQDDYRTAREKIMQSIIRSSEVLDTATTEAKTAPSPRSIEVCAGMAKALNESTKSLMDLHKEIRGLEQEKEEDKQTSDKTNGNIKTSLTSLLEEIENSKSTEKERTLQ